jgi:hypothetical protein
MNTYSADIEALMGIEAGTKLFYMDTYDHVYMATFAQENSKYVPECGVDIETLFSYCSDR